MKPSLPCTGQPLSRRGSSSRRSIISCHDGPCNDVGVPSLHACFHLQTGEYSYHRTPDNQAASLGPVVKLLQSVRQRDARNLQDTQLSLDLWSRIPPELCPPTTPRTRPTSSRRDLSSDVLLHPVLRLLVLFLRSPLDLPVNPAFKLHSARPNSLLTKPSERAPVVPVTSLPNPLRREYCTPPASERAHHQTSQHLWNWACQCQRTGQ